MRFIKVTLSVAMAALTLLALFSCGGRSVSSPTTSAFSGVYRSAFTRAISPDTELVIGVNNDGATRAAISDSNGILFVGSGNTMKDGTFNVLAAPPANAGKTSLQIQQVNIAATFYEEGFSATLAGAINETVGGPQFQEPIITCPFQGAISGQFHGDDSGTFNVSVGAQGSTLGLTHSGAGDLTLGGQVNNDGSLVLQVENLDGGTTLKGYVFLLPGQNLISGSGSWASKNGDRGTWEASGHIRFH